MIYYIYKITCLFNQKIYIGKKISLKLEDGYFGSGKLLKRAIEKYDRANFKKDIIEISSKESLSEREKFWIDFYKSHDRAIGYNISKGGDGGDTFTNNPNKEIIRIKAKLNRVVTPEYRDRQSKISKERWRDPLYREKVKASARLTFDNPVFLAEKSLKSKEKWKDVDFKQKQQQVRSTNKFKERVSEGIKNQDRYICNFCSLKVTKSNLVRWHDEKCKNNPGRDLSQQRSFRKNYNHSEETKEKIRTKALGRKLKK